MYPWRSFGLRAHQRQGFTLIELLVVVLIIGLLAAIALPRFLGHRTRARNAAAQSALRHALLAARSYYTQQGESYAGLGPGQLQGYESSLSGSEPADAATPGSSANPQDIWIGDGVDGTNPTGDTVVLCSISRGNAVYCARDVGGVTTYVRSESSSSLVSSVAGGAYTATGLSPVSSGQALQLTTGNYHNCALYGSGEVKCWGFNNVGQLGDGTAVYGTSVSTTAIASGATQISAGIHHTCAVMNTGALRCWGFNNHGQLGDGTLITRTTPITTIASGVRAVTAGGYQTCALLAGGAVKCWGWNQYGQLGDGSTTDNLSVPATPLIASEVTQIDSGYNHICALLTGGAVKCWGYNANGQVGDGGTTQTNSVPAAPAIASDVAQVRASGNYTCAVSKTGALTCWGYNAYGQLGVGNTTNKLLPGSPTISSGVLRVESSNGTTCAILQGGALKCWGNNAQGQLGDGSTTQNNSVPATPLIASGVAAVGSGWGHTCAMLSGGSAQCVGLGDSGQLGNGSFANSLVLVSVLGI